MSLRWRPSGDNCKTASKKRKKEEDLTGFHRQVEYRVPACRLYRSELDITCTPTTNRRRRRNDSTIQSHCRRRCRPSAHFSLLALIFFFSFFLQKRKKKNIFFFFFLVVTHCVCVCLWLLTGPLGSLWVKMRKGRRKKKRIEMNDKRFTSNTFNSGSSSSSSSAYNMWRG